MVYLLVFLVGLIASSLGSLVGLGGAFLIVPVLLFFGEIGWIEGMNPQLAAGTSLLALVFTGMSATVSHAKKRNVDFKSGTLFLLGIIPGSILGVIANSQVNGQSFNLYFGIWMLLLSFVLILHNRKPKPFNSTNKIVRHYIDHTGTEYVYGYKGSTAVLVAIAVGFISSLFGVGGGALMVPAMLLLFRFPTHLAIGTSMLVILLSTVVGSSTYLLMGNIHWLVAAAIIPGNFLGGKIGAYFSLKLKGPLLVLMLRLLLVIMGIRLIYQALFM